MTVNYRSTMPLSHCSPTVFSGLLSGVVLLTMSMALAQEDSLELNATVVSGEDATPPIGASGLGSEGDLDDSGLRADIVSGTDASPGLPNDGRIRGGAGLNGDDTLNNTGDIGIYNSTPGNADPNQNGADSGATNEDFTDAPPDIDRSISNGFSQGSRNELRSSNSSGRLPRGVSVPAPSNANSGGDSSASENSGAGNAAANVRGEASTSANLGNGQGNSPSN